MNSRWKDVRPDFDDFMRKERIAGGVVHVYCPHHGIHLSTRTEGVNALNMWAFEKKRDPITGTYEYVRWEADGGECPECKGGRR